MPLYSVWRVVIRVTEKTQLPTCYDMQQMITEMLIIQTAVTNTLSAVEVPHILAFKPNHILAAKKLAKISDSRTSHLPKSVMNNYSGSVC